MTDRAAVDTALTVGAFSSPWWLDFFHTVVQELCLLGGLILLCFRIAIAYREWQAKRRAAE